MTRCPRLSLNKPRHRRSRWVGAAVVIAGVHISGVAIGMMKWEDTAAPAAMPPAVMIDMLPPASPPPPQRQPDPEIDIPDSEIPPEPELSEFLPLPPPEVEPVVEMAPKVEKKKEKTRKVAEKSKEKPKKEKEKKKKDKKETRKPEPDQPKVVPPPAHDMVFKTASDAASATMQDVSQPGKQAAAGGGQAVAADGHSAVQMAAASAAKASWNSMLIAHLQKHQKYPRAAKRKNQTGIATVKFTVDRSGFVQDLVLISSSGVDSLDEEALETVRRAEPLPAVPAEMAGNIFTRDIPMQFKLEN